MLTTILFTLATTAYVSCTIDNTAEADKLMVRILLLEQSHVTDTWHM